MDADKILYLVKAHAHLVEDAHLVIATVLAHINGRSVRIAVTDDGEPGPYRYNATVYDESSGEFLATGNGAATLDEALGIVHWNSVRAEE